MYQYTPMQTIIKAVLNVGTIIVLLMAHEWLKREDTRIKQGEFYVLTLSTLLGMYFMISAGHFLMFFIGLEMASIPIAALVAFDKYRHHSAEAGAKYILTALFSSALLLFGLSMIYGTSVRSISMTSPDTSQAICFRLWHSCSSLPEWDSKSHWFLSTSGQPTYTKERLQP